MKLKIATLGAVAALMTATAASADYTYQDQYNDTPAKLTEGQAKFVSTENETAGPSSDFRVEGVRKVTIFTDDAPATDALGPRGGR
ncbi:hypothetical protein [Rhodalgimonas zhirmunskyi]|uniref:DUF680 domain-containing protein n=1 Tax=Rhodalgimonas zhirmunskyi TaxID=2964767 RepID=A0AAJ1U8W4_9RHOB|nr:hypothetical protein [Rhodoalgimonas zhirmunskyi]MDQ2095114.1 hypothetical protein [Rhodoalgimonas zhirmunskyi]